MFGPYPGHCTGRWPLDAVTEPVELDDDIAATLTVTDLAATDDDIAAADTRLVLARVLEEQPGSGP